MLYLSLQQVLSITRRITDDQTELRIINKALEYMVNMDRDHAGGDLQRPFRLVCRWRPPIPREEMDFTTGGRWNSIPGSGGLAKSDDRIYTALLLAVAEAD